MLPPRNGPKRLSLVALRSSPRRPCPRRHRVRALDYPALGGRATRLTKDPNVAVRSKRICVSNTSSRCRCETSTASSISRPAIGRLYAQYADRGGAENLLDAMTEAGGRRIAAVSSLIGVRLNLRPAVARTSPAG